jgi:hypothetical protein
MNHEKSAIVTKVKAPCGCYDVYSISGSSKSYRSLSDLLTFLRTQKYTSYWLGGVKNSL